MSFDLRLWMNEFLDVEVCMSEQYLFQFFGPKYVILFLLCAVWCG